MSLVKITSEGITDGSIVNADLHSAANIASSKLADSGVTAGSYGSATAIPAVTVNAKGIITGVSTNSVNTTTNLGISTATDSVTVTSSTGNNAQISEASGSAAGVMSVAHHDKLDGIEASATADQTASEIRTLVGNASDSNVFTDALLSKLNGIEASATADQSASEIVALIADQTIAPSVIDMADNETIKLGTGNDLELVHNGSHSIVKNNTGDFYIAGNSVKLVNAAINEDMLVATANGSVSLYHNSNKKLETSSSGVSVTGNVVVSGTVDGRDLASDGSKLDGIAAGANNITNNNQLTNGAGYITSASDGTKLPLSGGELSGDLITHNVRPDGNGNRNLGTSSYRWANIYTSDLNLSNEGGKNDVDGTWGSFTLQEGAESLFLINKRNGKKYKINLTEVS